MDLAPTRAASGQNPNRSRSEPSRQHALSRLIRNWGLKHDMAQDHREWSGSRACGWLGHIGEVMVVSMARLEM